MMGRRVSVTFYFLISVQCAQLAFLAFAKSPTWDEIGHFGAAAAYWEHGNQSLYLVNPPLVRNLAFLPVALFSSAKLRCNDIELSTWGDARPELHVGRELILRNGGMKSFWYFGVARIMCIPLILIGALSCYQLSKDLYGDKSGLIALTLWSFCPTIIGHGALVTGDVACASFVVLACWRFIKWSRMRTYGNAFLVGVASGLGTATKYTFFVVGIAILFASVFAVFARKKQKRMQIQQVALGVFSSLFILNSVYHWQGSFKSLNDYTLESQTLSNVQKFTVEYLCAGNIPLIIPENVILGIDKQKAVFENPSYSYFMGNWKQGGWLTYYLIGMLLKIPIGTIGIFLLSFAAIPIPKLRRSFGEEAFLAFTGVLLAIIVSSQTGNNDHFRYILPLFPILFVTSSRVGIFYSSKKNFYRIAAVSVCLVLLCVSSLLTFPIRIGYFNEFAGGSRAGTQWLAGSSTDWGQDLTGLYKWGLDHPMARPFFVSSPSLIQPDEIGISCLDPPITSEGDAEFSPRCGWYVVSVNHMIALDSRFKYLQRYPIVDWIGVSMVVIRVSDNCGDDEE